MIIQKDLILYITRCDGEKINKYDYIVSCKVDHVLNGIFTVKSDIKGLNKIRFSVKTLKQCNGARPVYKIFKTIDEYIQSQQ